MEKLESMKDVNGVQLLLQQMKLEAFPTMQIYLLALKGYQELVESELTFKVFYRVQGFDVENYHNLSNDESHIQ
uniref:Uncharacterized protein n=1 Tax=Nymphaea colorata TaxID=210225 RepID=A0A5K0XDG8_9MAGN